MKAVCHGYANGCACKGCARRHARHNTTGVARKEVREFIARELSPHGWRRVGEDTNGHPLFWHPDAPTDDALKVPSTPTGHNWKRQTLGQARRIWPDMPRSVKHTQPKKFRPATITGITPEARRERIIQHAATYNVTLTDDQADAILDRASTLAEARKFVNQIVAAQRRALIA